MAPTGPAGVSKRAFARAVGASESRIRQLVERGTLPVLEDGTIPVTAGSVAWEAHRKAAGGASALRPALPPPPSQAATAGSTPPSPAAPRSPAAEMSSMHEAELAKKLWDARMAELRYQERSVELVPLVEVREDAERAMTTIRTALLSLPSRVALALEAVCAGETGAPRAQAIEQAILREVNAILGGLHETRFTPSAPQRAAGEAR